MATPTPRQLQNEVNGPTAARSRVLKRPMYSEADNSFVQACQLALTPVVFGAIGFSLDQWLGIIPVFTIVFFVWAISVVTWMAWHRYNIDMAKHEAALPAKGLGREVVA